MEQIDTVSGVILAGGKSRRFGSNKALVTIDGSRLIDRVVEVMKAVFHHVVIITNTPSDYAYLGLPMYEDLVKGLGPIGGIYSGLTYIPDSMGFFVACDMPYLNEDLIRYMVKVKDDFDVVVPKITWKMEALHALYSKRCLSKIKDLIEEEQYQAIQLFPRVVVRYVDEQEISLFDPEEKSFQNVNRPQDIRRLSCK